MMTSAGLGAGQRSRRDDPRRQSERNIFHVRAGHHRARRGVIECIDEQIESVRVTNHRRPPGHRLLHTPAIQRNPLSWLNFCHRRAGTMGVPGSLTACPATDHEALQQAVGRQSVGTVHTGAGHLAGSEQARQSGPAVDVGAHPAAAVVRTRNYRDGLAHRVDTGITARGGDGREPLGEPLDGSGVEKDTLVSGLTQAGLDRSGHHVARGQVTHRVHARRHRLAAGIAQDRALTAQCLGDQRPPAGAVAVEQHGRVKLDELDIGDVHARP